MITDREHILTFGKYKGETIDAVLDADPGYLLWANNTIPSFDLHHVLYDEARRNHEDTESEEILSEIFYADLHWGKD